mgnify:CR=1 FL=1
MDNRFKQYKALISDVYDGSKMEVVQPKGKYALLVEDPKIQTSLGLRPNYVY